MNRALRDMQRRRTNFRKRGGGLSTGPSILVPFDPTHDWNITTRAFTNQVTPDCYNIARPGALASVPNMDLAQTPMAGGCCGASGSFARGARNGGRRTLRKRGGGCLARRTRGQRGGGCLARRSRGQRGGKRTRRRNRQGGGGCGCMTRRTRGQRGGTNGFSVMPGHDIGGQGPNAVPLYAPIPCSARDGVDTSSLPQVYNPDVRAPHDLYSLSPNAQTGGAYSTPNAFGSECYRAPGSAIPTYPANSAGFHFNSSIASNGALPDGVTPYNDVISHAARLGGGRRSRRHRRSGKKA